MKNFSFTKNRKVFFIIAAVVIALGICSFIFRGFNVDIDFIGGTTIQLEMNKELTAADLDEIKATINAVQVGDTPDKLYTETEEDTDAEAAEDATEAEDTTEEAAEETTEETTVELPKIVNKPQVSTVQKAGEGTQVIIKLLELDSESRDALCNILAGKYGLNLTTDLLGVNNVGASISSDLRTAAITAALIAILLMLVYISFRFEILSGITAVICLAHDVFIMFAAYSLLQIPLNSTMIAAILTILGYSINATIIVFDRVRENVKLHSKDDFDTNVDLSVKQTFRRSINTSLTTLFTIGMVYIFGVDSIKQFALPIIVGIFAGFYSSVCLSGNIWSALKKLFNKKRV